MPTYCYRQLTDDRPVEMVMSVAEREKRENPDGTMAIDGVKCRRDWAAEGGGSMASTSGWPLPSLAMAVHPDQIPEYARHDAQHGVPTAYDHTGRPVFTSRKHRKQYALSYGYHDRDGGVGDP